MDFFNKLVKIKFLANASNELRDARKVLQQESIDNVFSTPSNYDSDKIFWSFDKEEKKLDFEYIAEGLYLDRYINTSVGIMGGNEICVLSTEEVLIVCAYTKKQVDESVLYCYQVNGHLPYHRVKKKLKIGRYVHIALIWKEVKYDTFALN